ncbi:nucleotidyltransferase family protein [Nocardioides sp.]|uniref:nucleotidyltransferase family protein n=1 Tax=Nocardioides sp. TaxID=35761 RepID=UPI0039E21D8F
MRVAGLLLAAGAGSRMGTPKALVRDEDGPWLPRGVTTLRDGGCTTVTVVLGAAVAEAVELLDGLGVDTVVAHDWADGMSASLRAGLTSLDADSTEAALVHLVDLPDVGPDVVRRVLGAAGPGALARAGYQGVPGHPVLLGRDHWQGVVETATGDQGAKPYLRSHETALVECGDLATGIDVDSFPD